MLLLFYRRNRSAFFLTAILALILAAAIFSEMRTARLIIGLASVIAIGTGGTMLSAGRRWHTWFAITAIATLALQMLAHRAESPLAVQVIRDIFVQLIFFLCLYVVLKHALFTKNVYPLDRILSSICGYFLLALIGANVFALITLLDPDAFHLPDAEDTFDHRSSIYYSLVTLSTQGYGDIVPRSPIARIAAGLYGSFGTIYLAVIVGAMVSSLRSVQDSPDHD